MLGNSKYSQGIWFKCLQYSIFASPVLGLLQLSTEFSEPFLGAFSTAFYLYLSWGIPALFFSMAYYIAARYVVVEEIEKRLRHFNYIYFFSKISEKVGTSLDEIYDEEWRKIHRHVYRSSFIFGTIMGILGIAVTLASGILR